MKRFHFPLDRALQWRRTQVELEEARSRQLNAELHRIDRDLSELGAARDRAQREVLEAPAVDGAHLILLADYLLGAKNSLALLKQRRAEQERRIVEQDRRLLEARRAVRLLESLRERRLAEWRTELNRETETTAAESFLARWNRENARSRPSDARRAG